METFLQWLAWVIVAVAALWSVVLQRRREALSPIDPEKFQNLYLDVQALKREVADWNDYVERWTKRLDMRVRRGLAEEREEEPPANGDRKMFLRRLVAGKRE